MNRETLYGWELYVISSYLRSVLAKTCRHQDILWNEFPQWARLDPDIQRPTQPKPDLTYAFNIIDTAAKLYPKFKYDRYLESFSLPLLSELRNRKKGSVISSPTTKLRQTAKNKRMVLAAKDLMCFPWAIVEVKHGTERPVVDDGHMRHNNGNGRKHEKRKQQCYCQAANASAAGLTLREDLAVMAKDDSGLHDALIMFSFTCVGPTVKLWVTYREKPVSLTITSRGNMSPDSDKSEHKSKRERSQRSEHGQRRGRIVMVCIWATSLELTWGVMALRMVVENMREWVYTRVKPEISRWIRIVHDNPPRTTSRTPSGDTVVQRRRAASCEPLSEGLGFKGWDLSDQDEQHLTPHAKAMPHLSRGKTAPGSLNRWETKVSVPKIQLNGYVESNTGDTDDSADEGYASIHTSGHESEEDEEEKLSAFICDDEPSEDDQPDALYIPPSSEDESTESESAEEEEEEEEEEDYDLSDNEGSYQGLTQRPSASSRLDVYCTPTKNSKWRNASDDRKRYQSPSQRSRRCSSRF